MQTSSRDSFALLVLTVLYFSVLVLFTQLSLLPPLTVLLLHLMPVPIAVLGYSYWRRVQVNGVIGCFPEQTRQVLLQKSLIDVLMTIWSLPSQLEYFKRLIYPFFVPISKQEAIELFDDLSPALATKLEAKGLITLLPEGVQRVLEGEHAWNERFLAPMRVGGEGVDGRRRPGDESTASNSPKITPLRVETYGPARLRTQVISSSSTPLLKSSDTLDTAISRLRLKVPTLEPLFGHILGFQVRQVMSLVSQRGLAVGATGALVGLLVQFVSSRRVRRWTSSAIKLGAFGGCMCVLSACLFSLLLKYLHTRVQAPEKRPVQGIEKLIGLSEEISHEFVSRFEKEKPAKIHKAFS